MHRRESALDRRSGTEPGQEAETQRAHDRKLQAIGQLAGGVAHDFNNLLTAIISTADGVLERPGIDAETAADMRQIRLAGERGAALVRQLLMFGRRRTLEPGAVAVNAAIGSLAPLLRRVVGEKIRLDLRLEEPDQWVRADPTQLDQVLMNLAVNARDAMQPDRRAGGVLTLRTGHRLLHRPGAHGTEIIPPGRYVLIEVVDTGGGIPPDALPRVFEPFFTTRGKTGGSGLGLSTVLDIVRRSAGFVTVDSKVGEGTTICLYLPWHDGSGPAETASADIAASGATLFHPGSAPGPAPATGIARRGSLLLVEDEDQVRHLAQRALEQAGWRVLAARSGEEALTILPAPGDRHPAGVLTLLLCDIVLPGMDGPALVSEVRKIWPDLPAVLVSGYAESTVAGDLAAMHVRFLAKPYSLWELRTAVERSANGVPR